MSSFRLESPTRSLTMSAPKGVHLKALAGNVEVASNMDVILQSAAGLVSVIEAAPPTAAPPHSLVKCCGAATLP